MKFTKKITLSALLLGGALLTAPTVEASGITVDGAISPEEMEAIVAFSQGLRAGTATNINELELVISDDLVGALAHLSTVAGFAPVPGTYAAFNALLDALVATMYTTAGGAPLPADLTELDAALTALIDPAFNAGGGAPHDVTLAGYVNGSNLFALLGALNTTKGGAASVDFPALNTALQGLRGATGLTTPAVGAATTAIGDDIAAIVANIKARITASVGAANTLNGAAYGTGAQGAANEAPGNATAGGAGLAEILSFFSSYLA